MLILIPKHVPPLSMMLADMANPKPREVARALGVTERTVQRWLRADRAPRAVLLALFWLTRWGQSAVDCHAHNSATLSAAVAASLTREVENLNAKVGRLARIGDFGAANDPAPGVALAPMAPAALRQTAPELGRKRGRPPDSKAGSATGSTAETTKGTTTGKTQQPRGFQRG